ncbi:hypothetical protein [Marinobacter sp.]|uniref:hypothetical protein n=1 Tax=Marinobacter sp. TaxID=50741 RepID=UPI000C8EFC5F|nr:hypothetical protein [Marinobacter sp.]MAB53550.1 hypothetical protein [Marinobacter sp.]
MDAFRKLVSRLTKRVQADPVSDEAGVTGLLTGIGITPQALYAERRRFKSVEFHAAKRHRLEKILQELEQMDLPPDVRKVVDQYRLGPSGEV